MFGSHNTFQATQYLAIAAILFATAIGTPPDQLFASEAAYQTTLKSTAWIVSNDATGTGVLIDHQQRLLITNQHVVAGQRHVQVFFPVLRSGTAVNDPAYYMKQRSDLAIKAEVVASDSSRDVAILKLERVPEGVTEIKLGTPGRPGQNIHSIGNPNASDALWIYTYGKVRANYYRKGIFDTGVVQMQTLETQSPINPGDSGGPIVNDAGELIAISQGMSTNSRLYSYGVDISEIKWFVKRYRQNAIASDLPASSSSDDGSSNASADSHTSRRVATKGSNLGSFKDLHLFSKR